MTKWIYAIPPFLFVFVHSGALTAAKIDLDRRHDWDTLVGFIVFKFVDFPVVCLLNRIGWRDEYYDLLIFGGLQWLIIGGYCSAGLYWLRPFQKRVEAVLDEWGDSAN